MADIADRTQDFGANSWLVEEMYERYRADQNSVSEAWREFFSDYRSAATAATSAASAPAATASPLASSNGSAVAQSPAAPVPAPAASAVAPVTAVPQGSKL
jgi:2-oxoglutarate dehydrogenase complex dehydrogenase (E1) component-like enzyme